MLPGFDITQFALHAGSWAALLVAALIIFAESGLLIGFFLPGDSLLFTVGLLAYGIGEGDGRFRLAVPIWLVLLVLMLAAVIGDSVGYAIGRRMGPLIFRRKESLLFRQENVTKAREFYERHGGKTIILARFIPVVRTFVPVIAGVARMRYATFLAFNVIGGVLWAVGVTLLGYFLGDLFERLHIKVDTVLLPIIAVIILVSILPPLIHLLKDRDRRTAAWAGICQLFRRRPEPPIEP